MSAAADLTSRLATGLPDPSPRFAGYSDYNFIGGHNDPERIPIEELIEASASVLRREGSRLAMCNLGQAPQGFVGLREFVADKLNRHRGMKISRDDVLITSGSGQGLHDFVALVVPELQRRGLFRTEYEGRTLRENLDLPRPVSRYAARPARHRNVLMLD